MAVSADRESLYTKTSFGADVNPMKFYSTTYSSSFGHEGFKPRLGLHSGSGYVPNHRPALFYTSKLDRHDNPVLGVLLKDNYVSVTKKHFTPYELPSGREDFPYTIHAKGSGFMREKPLNIPVQKDMKEVHVDTKKHGPVSLVGIEPKFSPLLHKIQPKDVVEQENSGHGPKFMSTEYKSKYKPKALEIPALTQHRRVGFKENTGFTEGLGLEPITYHPPSTYKGDLPGYCTDRPTGVSITSTDFLPSGTLHGDEFLPVIANRFDNNTGFTREVGMSLDTAMPQGLEKVPTNMVERLKREDPIEYLNRTHRDGPSSISTLVHSKPEKEPRKTELLGRVTAGDKQPSGSTTNEKGYIPLKKLHDRFLTNYKIGYYDKSLKGLDREGWTWGGIQKAVRDGFTHNTNIHKLGTGTDSNDTESLRRIHPHVARTLKAKDKFYDDHTYDHKQRVPGLTI